MAGGDRRAAAGCINSACVGTADDSPNTSGMSCNHCVDLEIPDGTTCSYCLGSDECGGCDEGCPSDDAERIYTYADDVVACVLEHAAENPGRWRTGPKAPRTRLDVGRLHPRRVMAAWLEWQGILGYADRILAIMGVSSEVLEPDELQAAFGGG